MLVEDKSQIRLVLYHFRQSPRFASEFALIDFEDALGQFVYISDDQPLKMLLE